MAPAPPAPRWWEDGPKAPLPIGLAVEIPQPPPGKHMDYPPSPGAGLEMRTGIKEGGGSLPKGSQSGGGLGGRCSR